MEVEVLKNPTPLECRKCGYTWTYGGKSPYFATCPYCRNIVNVKKSTIVQTNPQVSGPERFAQSSTNEGSGVPEPIGKQ